MPASIRKALWIIAGIIAVVPKRISALCDPLCSFDRQTQQCVVGRPYASQILRAYQGGVLGSIATQLTECTAIGSGARASAVCSSNANCELDERGMCSARRTWAAAKLAAMPADGGIGLGDARCGFFGELLVHSSHCLAHRNRTACEANGAAPANVECAWDSTRGSCDVSRKGLLIVLRQRYRDELALASLRQARCASQPNHTCTGDCQWHPSSVAAPGRMLSTRRAEEAGRCLLRPMTTLLAMVGEDCPLRFLFTRSTECGEAQDSLTCQSILRSDGLPQCTWRSDTWTCQAHPVVLEHDLLMLLGADSPQLLDTFSSSQRKCGALSSISCEYLCTPDQVTTSRAAVHSITLTCAALLLPLALYLFE